ncbi:hypothetical protein Lesp02_19290 [Lentzea sp. NBRC 105346]|uniref:DUF3592 domain-containing protein n=1 Tax=Lentzea sp. NBRC 105346 TaxID=3032205 RepID=UPI0024A5DB7B|nr:DUF3592 domain-containing protein [Lentzea sp. NBRC 105346]GLZ29739.1 hypothetical protein Lesp02_19290 [Lentzea sp. NBRC 105346]
MIVILIWAFIGVTHLVYGLYVIIRTRLIIRRQTSVTGRIIDHHRCLLGRGRLYHPVVSYNVGTEGFTVVAAGATKQRWTGGEVQVCYDPAGPDRAVVRGLGGGHVGGSLVMGVVMTGFLLWFLWPVLTM